MTSASPAVIALQRCVVSVSGIRGIVGPAMNSSLMDALGVAVGATLARGKTVVVGRDARASGPLLAQSLIAGLRAVGCTVIDIGVVPTPTVPLVMEQLRASAGCQISASHNPEPWNALKIYRRQGGRARNVDQQELAQVIAAVERPQQRWYRPWDRLGGLRQVDDALERHLQAVLAHVDVPRIRARAFTVVMDSVNGSGSVIGPRLLDALGCRVIPFYTDPDRPFPRDPEPTAANVRETGACVAALGADIGFVQDPDADRLAVIDERGRYIGEEYTLVLCAAARFAAAGGKRGAVAVTNLSTSRMLEDVAAEHGGRVVRTPVGEANVLDAMGREQALIGGEGNGGIIDPRVVWCRDSQTGMALILDYLARRGSSISQVVAAIPSYAMHKEKVALTREAVSAAIPRIRESSIADGATLDTRDGLKLIWADRWLHLRASGTEPASRIISEAPDARSAKQLAINLRRFLKAELISGH